MESKPLTKEELKQLKEAKLAKKAEKQETRKTNKDTQPPLPQQPIKEETLQNNENPIGNQSKIEEFNVLSSLNMNQLLFSLTSYDNIVKLKEKDKKHIKPNEKEKEKEFHSRKQVEIETRVKGIVSSNELLRIHIDYDLPVLNDEIFLLLLKMSNNSASRQKEYCYSLLLGLTKYIIKLEKHTAYDYISTLIKNFEKLSLVIRRITLVLGSIENTLNYISKVLSSLLSKVRSNKTNDIKEIKDEIIGKLNDYSNERLLKVSSLIAKIGSSLVKNDDCILIFGLNEYLKEIITECVKKGIDFSIVYVKTNDNKKTLDEISFLSSSKVNVVFTCIVSISNIINSVSKVFLQAKSMLSNGNLLGRNGSSIIAHVANHFKIPVIVFCETFKFWNKIQIDSFHVPNVYFTKDDGLKDVNRLCLHYDITSANLIKMIICELGLIPPTSIKVILREYVNEESVVDG